MKLNEIKKKFAMTGVIISAAILMTACGRNGAVKTESNAATESVKSTQEATERITEAVSIPETEAQVIMETYIQEIDGKILVLADAAGGLYQMDTEGVSLQDEQGSPITIEDLKTGQAAELLYNGITMRNYPATIPAVTSFTLVQDKRDPYEVYRNILKTIWENNTELNEGIELVALDLTETENMTKDQWGVISYYMRQLCQCEVRLATEDELEADGIIDRERDQFTDIKGMLISLDDEREQGNIIEFEAEKWISDQQEAEYDNGSARYENGSWSVQL